MICIRQGRVCAAESLQHSACLREVYSHPTHFFQDKIPMRKRSSRLLEGLHGGQLEHFAFLLNLYQRLHNLILFAGKPVELNDTIIRLDYANCSHRPIWREDSLRVVSSQTTLCAEMVWLDKAHTCSASFSSLWVACSSSLLATALPFACGACRDIDCILF